MRKFIILLFLPIFFSAPVIANGVYNEHTIYNISNILKVTKVGPNTVKIYYINNKVETINFKSSNKAYDFFSIMTLEIIQTQKKK